MVSSQSANTTTPTMSQSGISSNIPKVLPYIDFISYKDIQKLEHIYCYIQECPANVDLTMLIYRDIVNQDVITIFADRRGIPIELTTDRSVIADAARKFIKEKLADFVKLMSIIRIQQAQYHFWVKDEEVVLVDVRTAINKCVSPGMIEEVYGKIIKTLRTKNIMVLEPSTIDAIIQGGGQFESDLLIRPSRFRAVDESLEHFKPLYVEIRR